MDVRPDKTTHTGLPLTPRPSIAAVPTISAGAVLLLFTSSTAAALEIGHGMGVWGKYVKPCSGLRGDGRAATEYS